MTTIAGFIMTSCLRTFATLIRIGEPGAYCCIFQRASFRINIYRFAGERTAGKIIVSPAANHYPAENILSRIRNIFATPPFTDTIFMVDQFCQEQYLFLAPVDFLRGEPLGARRERSIAICVEKYGYTIQRIFKSVGGQKPSCAFKAESK